VVINHTSDGTGSIGGPFSKEIRLKFRNILEKGLNNGVAYRK
jgi:hypothetical protein